jgi:translation initiation factor IF-1
MVRNLTGGTKTKGIARKHQNKSSNGFIRLPQCEEEQFAYVSKVLGNGMCEVFINEKQRLIAHIRNKFRGKQKRHNMISPHMIVLAGLRSWESTLKNCDILYVYDDNEINQLKIRPDIGIDNVINLQNANAIVKTDIVNDDTLLFNDETEVVSNTIVSQDSTQFESFDVGNDIDLDDV